VAEGASLCKTMKGQIKALFRGDKKKTSERMHESFAVCLPPRLIFLSFGIPGGVDAYKQTYLSSHTHKHEFWNQ